MRSPPQGGDFLCTMSFSLILFVCLAAVNLAAYLVMAYDKYRSKTAGRRIPEKVLFLLALLFGASGIYLGMQGPLYHKAAKPLFKYGIPLLILANAAALYLAWRGWT